MGSAGHSSLLCTARSHLITLRSSFPHLCESLLLMGDTFASFTSTFSCMCVSRWLGRSLPGTEEGSEGVPVARGTGRRKQQQQSITWQHLNRCVCSSKFNELSKLKASGHADLKSLRYIGFVKSEKLEKWHFCSCFYLSSFNVSKVIEVQLLFYVLFYIISLLGWVCY